MIDVWFVLIDNNLIIFDIFYYWIDWWVKLWLIKLFSCDIIECVVNFCKNKLIIWCIYWLKIYIVSWFDLWLGLIFYLGLIVFLKKYEDDYYGYLCLLIIIM